MDGMQKLRTLLIHWRKHNEAHTETYRKWSEKISAENKDLAEILARIHQESKKLDDLFEEALRRIGS